MVINKLHAREREPFLRLWETTTLAKMELGLLTVLCCLLALDVHSHVLKTEETDYETEMGRILAVNMELMKRHAARSKRGNVFGEIEKNNEQNNQTSRRFYQGDIIMDRELEELIHGSNLTRTKRNAIREKKILWKTRIIPYYVPPHMTHIIDNLNQAIWNFHDNTCLRFVEYDYTQPNYIRFDNNDGCSSRVGTRYAEPGYQTVSLGDGCNFVGTIIHELMHAIGFFHEQAREDRDSFVKINWDNIMDGFSNQFDKYSWKTIDDLGKDYDYKSIMHYDRTAFTKNGLPTIENIYDGSVEFGNAEKRLSQKDIIEINALYDCISTTTYGWSSWTEYTPCDENCFKTRERYCYNYGDPQSCQGNPNPYGIEKETVSCPLSECLAVDGSWGRWSEWSQCSVTCGDGFKSRTRQCDNPTPMHDGKYCPGFSSESDGCVMRRCVLGFDDIDFETSYMGIWTNVDKLQNSDKLDWQRHKSYTQTVDTGPNADHTLGTSDGYYLYVESSTPAQANDNALLRSQWMDPVYGGQCLKFYYTMYGSTMGELRVHIELEGVATYLLFRESGNKGIGWKNVNKNIDTSVRYRLTFEAIIGGTGYSDIAIDDVYIDPGLCNCQDTYFAGCPTWAATGECQNNEQWMKNNCQRSCNSCPASCLDSDVINCPKWAIKGDCDVNSWMMDNCKKSCGVCGCEDESSNCPAWQQGAQCETNPDYMLANCQSSCKVCGCKDLDPLCSTWAQSGECGKNPVYMLDKCCRSCRCENWVKNEDCDAWKSADYCTLTPVYMLLNCKKSCGVC